jgi:hypothetical protein
MSLGGSRTGAWNPAGIMGKMATAIEGERNETLVWAAHRIGFDVHRGKVKRRDADAGCEQLHHVAVMVGLGEQEVERTIRSGYAAGLCGRPGKAGAA